MKTALYLFIVLLTSCETKKEADTTRTGGSSIAGTWKLLSGTLVENGKTTVTDYTKNVSFIKIINEDHFAFLQHDLKKGADSSKVFVAGGGSYFLRGSDYTEHLEYCSDRGWEGNDFPFKIILLNDTLIQTGIEKVESKGINRLNTEKYIRIK